MPVTQSESSIIRKNSAGSDFKRRRVNLIEGSNVTLTVSDDSTNNEVDVTIASSGSGTISGTDTHVLFFDGADNPAGDAGLTYNKTTDVLTVNTIPIGKGAGAAAIKIGASAAAGNDNNVGIGNTAVASGTVAAVAIGGFSTASGSTSVAIGGDSTASDSETVAIGSASSATNDQAVAIGESSSAAGVQSIAIGKSSSSPDSHGVSIGHSAAAGAFGIAIGNSTTAGEDTVSLGNNVSADMSTQGIAIGDNTNLSSQGGVAIGEGATVDGTNAIAIGSFAFAEDNYSLAVGKDSRTTAANQIVFGADTNDGTGFDEMWVGHSTASTAAEPFTIHVTNHTGTNAEGNDLTITSGAGTGNAVGGEIIFQTPEPTGSGTDLQTLTTRLTIGITNITAAKDILVPDEAYDATAWNGSLEVPTKNAIRDKIESMSAASGITRTIVTTSGSATMGSDASTDYVYFVAGAHTMSLPAASGNTNRYTVKNLHSAAITIDTAGAENVEGASSLSLQPNDAVDIFSDDTNWFVV